MKPRSQELLHPCSQKKLLGRDLTESEVAEIDAKIRKYYPDAQK